MKKTLSTVTYLVLFTITAQAQGTETLQTITQRGNSTTYGVKILDQLNIGNGNGLEFFKSPTQAVINAFDRGGSNSFQRLSIGSSVTSHPGRLLLNSVIDDGVTALQVNSGIKTSSSNYRAFTANVTGGYATIDINENNNRRVFIGYNAGTYSNNYATFGVVDDNGVERGIFVNRFTGNVGIGIIPNTPAKLAVNGDLYAKRVKVTLSAADWPDFVFNENYQLPSLQKIEKYIIEHKHLPGIPSAEDVQRDGVDLGEINKNLLQKIEELTLYLINQQKEIEELKEWKKNVEAK
jgi:hypothetical protein